MIGRSRKTSAGGISKRLAGAVLFGLLAALLAASATCVAEAQQPRKVPRIGVLWAYSPPVASPLGEALRKGLRELDYIEGQNVVLEERWAGREYDRLPTLAAELVRLNVDIIVTGATPAIQAAQHATKTIPIVMAISNDPVESGFVASLARPGSNITGLSTVSPELSGRRLELLKAVSPKISRLAVLWNPSNPSHPLLLRETETAARVLGVQLQALEARGAAELDSAYPMSFRYGLPDSWISSEGKGKPVTVCRMTGRRVRRSNTRLNLTGRPATGRDGP